MDSLTQIVLGSALTLATMGRRTAAWKAATWGAVAGTLPDLDALYDRGDSILNMVMHRAESHSLFYLSLASLPLAWLVSNLHREQTLFTRWWLALWLVLITHPLLDWMTVYGTQLLLPWANHPYAVGSIFIIDPLYTLPLLFGVIAALWRGHAHDWKWARAGLVFSTLYLGWSVLAQQIATTQVRATPPEPGLRADQILVTPAPFNTLLWRAVAVTPTHYYEGYTSLLDGGRAVQWTQHPRGAELYAVHRANPLVQRIARFSHGFFRMSEEEGQLFITDLRMGYESSYSFHFNLGTLAQREAGAHGTTQQFQRPDLATALPWLWQRMWGHDVALPTAEKKGAGETTRP